MPRLHRPIRLALTALLGALLTLSSCRSMYPHKRAQLYPRMYAESPKTILLVPPIDRIGWPDLRDQLYAGLAPILTNRGYYVYAPSFTSEYLRDKSLLRPEEYLGKDLEPFRKIFGTDAVLFTVIHQWDQHLNAELEFEVQYILRSTKSNEILYTRELKGRMDRRVLAEGEDGGFFGWLFRLFVNAVGVGLKGRRSAIDQVNNEAFSDLPLGPYLPKYGKDGSTGAAPSRIPDLKL
nr:GNA1162 family protein [uncultured Porphyromonas sp.]